MVVMAFKQKDNLDAEFYKGKAILVPTNALETLQEKHGPNLFLHGTIKVILSDKMCCEGVLCAWRCVFAAVRAVLAPRLRLSVRGSPVLGLQSHLHAFRGALVLF